RADGNAGGDAADGAARSAPAAARHRPAPRVRRQDLRGHGLPRGLRVRGAQVPVALEARDGDRGHALERLPLLRLEEAERGGRGMIEFFRTPMGQRFFESTMPSLVRELARLNTSRSGRSPAWLDGVHGGLRSAKREVHLERLVAVVEKGAEPPTEDEPAPAPP